MRTRSQPISPNGFQSLQTPPRRKRTRQTAPSSGSPKQQPKSEPKTESTKVTKRAPKQTGRKRKAPPRKKQTATPAQEETQPEPSPQQLQQSQQQQQDEPKQQQQQQTVLTERENVPSTPAQEQQAAEKGPSSGSRKRSRQSLNETESESNAQPSKRPQIMSPAVARHRLRPIRPYSERRHRQVFGNQESIEKTLLDLPRLRAQFRGENKENAGDPDELKFTLNLQPSLAPTEDVESPLQHPAQASQTAPTTPDQPSRWSFRNFFGVVPQTISRVLSPLRAAAPAPPATPATPAAPPTPTPANQQQETQNQPTLPVQQEQTETQRPPSPPRDLTYSLFPPPIPRPAILANKRPAQSAQPTTTTNKPKTRKRKRDSPEVIPNPPGCSYGMHPDYFYVDSDDEEESGEEAAGEQGTRTAGSNERDEPQNGASDTPYTGRAKKRVRFAESPQNTPSKARSSQDVTQTSGHTPPGSPSMMAHGAQLAASGPGSVESQLSSSAQQPSSATPSTTIERASPAYPGTSNEHAHQRAQGYDGDITREEIRELAQAHRESLLRRQRELGGQVELIGLPLIWPPGPDELDPPPFPRSATGTFELRYDDSYFADYDSDEEREALEYEANLSPAEKEELEQWRREQEELERIIEQQDFETRIILERERRREQQEREAQQAREAEEAQRAQQAREAEEAQRAQQAREAEEARRVQQSLQAQQVREAQGTREVTEQHERADREQQELSKVRSQAEKYKPRLPSGLRASKRHSASPMPPFNWPHSSALGEVPAVDGPSRFSHELGGLSLSLV